MIVKPVILHRSKQRFSLISPFVCLNMPQSITFECRLVFSKKKTQVKTVFTNSLLRREEIAMEEMCQCG